MFFKKWKKQNEGSRKLKVRLGQRNDDPEVKVEGKTFEELVKRGKLLILLVHNYIK